MYSLLRVSLYFISPSNKTSRKKTATNLLCSSLFSFRFKKCDSFEFEGGGGVALPPYPSPLSVYALGFLLIFLNILG